MSMVSSKRPHSLHLGPSSGFQRMLCWYQLARRLLSWAAMIKPSVSALRPAAFSHLWVLSWSTSACFTRCGYLLWRAFDCHSWPELLVTVVFGFGICSSGIGGVRLILCRWYCGHSQFPTGLHWLSADGVQGFPVVMIFDKVGEGVLRPLEVFIRTDSGRLGGMLQLYEPSISFGSGQVRPVHVRFGVTRLVYSSEFPSLCFFKFGQLF